MMWLVVCVVRMLDDRLMVMVGWMMDGWMVDDVVGGMVVWLDE